MEKAFLPENQYFVCASNKVTVCAGRKKIFFKLTLLRFFSCFPSSLFFV